MANWNTVKRSISMDQGEVDPNAGIPTDNDVQSVQSLFDTFRAALTGIVETSLSTLVDDEWVRTTISTALTQKLQCEADQMAIATVDELRSQVKQHNENGAVKLNANRRAAEVRMETQKTELSASNKEALLQQQLQLEEKYAARAREGQEEMEKLKKSLESSLMQQLASQAALQKSRKENSSLNTLMLQYKASTEKLEANQGAVGELEAMKKALQSEVAAVRSFPEPCPRLSAYNGLFLHR